MPVGNNTDEVVQISIDQGGNMIITKERLDARSYRADAVGPNTTNHEL